MILVTGGLSFIGSHTVRALLDLGAPCLATAHRSTEVPALLHGAEVVALDVTDRAAVLALRDRYPITAIVHLAGALSSAYDARNLDIHHIVPRAHGGGHELWNMTLLCSGHQVALHDGLLELHGQAPYDIEVRWVYGPAATRARS